MDAKILRRYFEHVTDRTEFYDWIGLRPVVVEEGRVVGEVPFDERLVAPSPPGPGSVHGGVVATLVDMSAVGAVVTTVEDPREAFVSTTDLAIEFVDPARDSLRAEAVVTGADRRTAEVEVEITRGDADGADATGGVDATGDADGVVATGEVVCRVAESALDAERL